jgi:hypothetical protein
MPTNFHAALNRRRMLGAGFMGTAMVGGASQAVPAYRSPAAGLESLNPVDFGALCDGVRDDTSAVQRAIDGCLTHERAKSLLIPGRCRITAPLRIDRPVDTELSEFMIHGRGEGAGFYTDRAIPLFDSSLPSLDGHPVSEFVTFENLMFEAKENVLDAFVLSKKFLRMNFSNCVFQKIRVGDFHNPLHVHSYAQDFTFVRCNFRRWTGSLFSVAQFFALNVVSGCLFEAGGAAFLATKGAFGLVITAGAMEGSYGPFLQIAGGFAIQISGNYTEDNANPDYILTDIAAGGVAQGVIFEGNFMQVRSTNPTFFNVIVGDVRGMLGAGNYCSANLYDDNQTRPGELLSHDSAAGVLNRSGKPVRVAPVGHILSEDALVLTSAGQAVARPLVMPLTRIVSAVAGASVRLPPILTTAGLAQQVTVVNDARNPVQVFATGSDRVNSADPASGVIQAPGTVRTYYSSYAARKWFG